MRRTAIFILLAFAPLLRASEKWEKLEGCRLNMDAYFDGDSFRVFHKNKEIIIRLYFVDCPETDNSFPDRVKTQTGHFGKSIEETLHVGSYAKQAAAQLLSRRFTVTTKYQDAMGKSRLPRYFGFVTTSDGKDLGEILVANGLARSYGAQAAPPGKSAATLRARYDRLEDRARRGKYGLYSPEPLRAIARAKTDDFEDITPEPAPQIASVTAAPAPAVSIPPVAAPTPQTDTTQDGGKININTASRAELETLPGIGPATAERIIAERPFQSVPDLLRVRGIGEMKLNALTAYVTAQ